MPLFPSNNDMIPLSAMSNDTPMTADRTTKVVTEHAAYQSDLLTRRKAWVSGTLKNDSFIYASKAVTAGGSGLVTFYITDDGTSSGNAVFTNVYSDTVAVNGYGTGGQYQASGLTVSGDKKSITATMSQLVPVLVVTFSAAAANGIECRLYVMGD